MTVFAGLCNPPASFDAQQSLLVWELRFTRQLLHVVDSAVFFQLYGCHQISINTHSKLTKWQARDFSSVKTAKLPRYKTNASLTYATTLGPIIKTLSPKLHGLQVVKIAIKGK